MHVQKLHFQVFAACNYSMHMDILTFLMVSEQVLHGLYALYKSHTWVTCCASGQSAFIWTQELHDMTSCNSLPTKATYPTFCKGFAHMSCISSRISNMQPFERINWWMLWHSAIFSFYIVYLNFFHFDSLDKLNGSTFDNNYKLCSYIQEKTPFTKPRYIRVNKHTTQRALNKLTLRFLKHFSMGMKPLGL